MCKRNDYKYSENSNEKIVRRPIAKSKADNSQKHTNDPQIYMGVHKIMLIISNQGNHSEMSLPDWITTVTDVGESVEERKPFTLWWESK